MLGYHTSPAPGSRHLPPGADTPREQTTPLGADTLPEQTAPQSRHPPGADTPRSRHPLPRADTPRERRPLLRTVRILLECILVQSFDPTEKNAVKTYYETLPFQPVFVDLRTSFSGGWFAAAEVVCKQVPFDHPTRLRQQPSSHDVIQTTAAMDGEESPNYSLVWSHPKQPFRFRRCFSCKFSVIANCIRVFKH